MFVDICSYLLPWVQAKWNKNTLWLQRDLKNLIIIGKLTALSGDRKDVDKIILKVI